MNEKIKALVEQAGFNPHYEPDGTLSYANQFEKFAELIVKECVKLLRNEPTSLQWLGGQSTKYIQLGETVALIHEHFGVKDEQCL